MRSSIAYRVIIAVCIFSAGLTMISTAFRLYGDYRTNILSIEESIHNIEVTTLQSISQDLWMMDTEQLNIHLAGLLNIPHMEHVKIQSGSKDLVAAGILHSKKTIHREIPVVYNDDGKAIDIGTLHVNFSLTDIQKELWQAGYSHLLTQSVQIFLIALFILIIVRHMITRHLSVMANHVARLDAGNLEETLTLPERRGDEDELDRVASSLNAMSRKLKSSFDTLKLNEERLEALLIMSRMKMTTEKDLGRYALEEAIRLTRSRIGYLHFLNNDERTIQSSFWSDDVHPACATACVSPNFPEQVDLWTVTASSKKPVVNNDYQGCAEKRGRFAEHLPVLRHMSVPVVDDDKIVAVAGVGNKSDPYDESDVLQLSIFMNNLWVLIKERRTGSALKQSEYAYRTLAENLPGLVYRLFVREKNGFRFFNTMGESITGFREDEMTVGAMLPLERLIAADQRKSVLDSVARAVQERKPFSVEYDIIHRDGGIRHVIDQGMPVMGPDGNPLFIDGVIFDITDRKHSEETLRKSQEFIKNILDTVDEGFIVVDPGYRILTANKAYCAQTKRGIADVIGRTCYQVSHGSAVPCHDAGQQCAVRETFLTGKPSAAIHEHRDGDGRAFFVEIKSFPLKDHTGSVVSAIEIVNDVTDKRRLEEQFRQSQKMEAVGMLAGGVAHDFNNILSAIIGYGNLLTMKMQADDPLTMYVEQILQASGRAANLTQSLLAFSRKQLINPRPVDLNGIIRNLEKLLGRVISEEIDLTSSLHPQPLMVLADSGQIEQVLMNLTTNARDAMPNGGMLLIRTETGVIDEQFIKTFGFGTEGTYALLSVTDSGVGMNDDTKKRIFEPFFTTKAQGRGTGLGLSMVYGAVKQNNGHITVYSEPGKGTSFKIYFPLLNNEPSQDAVPAATAARGGTETVLIAEDDDTLRNLTSLVLKEYGYTTIEAKDGLEALRRYQENRDAIKLLILDVIMPKKDGKVVYHEVLRMKPDMKVLFISGYTANVLHSKGILDEEIHFLAKPVEPVALAKKVRTILDDGTHPGHLSGASTPCAVTC